jgi:hypothetical protein
MLQKRAEISPSTRSYKCIPILGDSDIKFDTETGDVPAPAADAAAAAAAGSRAGLGQR